MADEVEFTTTVEEIEEEGNETAEETVDEANEGEENEPSKEDPLEEEAQQESTEGAVDEEQDFIIVASSEDGDPMEFPKEADNTVTFSTIKAQFPKATGLKYRASSGAWRAIRDVDNVLAAPKEGWGNTLYVISVPDIETDEKTETETESETRKRKADIEPSDETTKPKQTKKDRETEKLLKDLPVTSLPYSCTEEQLKEYFETNYGEIENCQIKTERGSSKSRGFGFVRFKDAETAKEAVNNSHKINGREFFVKMKTDVPMKLFVGRIPVDTTEDDLREYFEEFGDIDKVAVPTKPFKHFAFVTFSNKYDALKALRKKEHFFKGNKLNVDESVSDNNKSAGASSRGGDRSGRSRGDSRGGRPGNRNSSGNNNRSNRNDNYRGGGGAGVQFGNQQQQQLQMQQDQLNNLGAQIGGNVLEQLILASYLGGGRL